jgi:hypothetical protein
MEPISITAMVVSIITAFGLLLSRLKFKHCLCCCIESDCIKTPENTPNPSISNLNNVEDIYVSFPHTTV